MVIIDVPGNGGYYVPSGGASAPVTAASLAQFVKEYKEGTLERSQLTRG